MDLFFLESSYNSRLFWISIWMMKYLTAVSVNVMLRSFVLSHTNLIFTLMREFFNFDFIHNIIYKSIWSTDKLYTLLHQLQCTSSQFNYNKFNYYTLKVCEYIFLQSLYRATAVGLICCRDKSIWKRKKMLGHHNMYLLTISYRKESNGAITMIFGSLLWEARSILKSLFWSMKII